MKVLFIIIFGLTSITIQQYWLFWFCLLFCYIKSTQNNRSLYV